jgi:hypothetical protein
MVRQEHIPWQWLILGILDDFHNTAALRDIYERIEKQYLEIKADGTQLINPSLLQVNLDYGNRAKFQHSVRACLSGYKKKGWVERIDRGVYRLTEKGRERLKWVQKNT